jgi:hypothetical protein
MTRLFASSITCIYDDKDKTGIFGVRVIEAAELWWDPKAPDQAPLWKSRIELGKRFFEEAINSPVPVDMRALKALKRSPLALDIYCWLTYRLSYLRKPTEIPWPVGSIPTKVRKATSGSGVIPDPQDGLPAGAEVSCDGGDGFAVFDFLAHDPLLIR